MLVLTRRPGEAITIGDPASAEEGIEIVVVEIRGGEVRLGIKAPKSVTVHRKEVYLQLQPPGQPQP